MTKRGLLLKDFKIVNVVASTKIDRTIDIELLSTRLKQAEYNPEIWCGLTWRRSNPKSTIIMFSTGKVSSVGTRSEKDAKIAIRKAVQAIPELSNARYNEPVIANLVATADVGLQKKLDFDLLSSKIKPSTYEPDQFPAMLYRSKHGTFLIFSSGKISLVGAKSEQQAKKDMRNLISRIRSLSKKGS